MKGKIHNVGVISLNANDFLYWKEKNGLKGEGLDDKRKFKAGNKVYFCLTSIGDTCSLELNEVIETEKAKLNKEYEEIISIIQHDRLITTKKAEEEKTTKEKDMNTEYTYDINQFTYTKETNTLSAEAINLYTHNKDNSLHPNPFPNGKQQFTIKNYQTGNHRRFRFVKEGEMKYTHTVTTQEGQGETEITSQQYWLYEAEDGVLCRVYLP